MSDANLYEALIGNASVLDSQAPPRKARISAAVVLWRRGAAGIEVFWVRRSPKLRFMGGWHAFAGGVVSRHDAATPLHGEPTGASAVSLAAGAPSAQQAATAPHLADGVAACALRELFEETGVVPLIQEDPELAPPTRAALDDRRRSLLAKGEKDAVLDLRDLGLVPDAGRLVFAGRWKTPPVAPVSFDNRFFLLQWPQDRVLQPRILPPEEGGGELDTGEWIRPVDALRAWEHEEVLTSPPILHILRVLAEADPESAEALARLHHPDEANLGPLRRIEFRPRALLFPLEVATLPPATHVGCYLLGDSRAPGGETVLVDPGSGNQRELDHLELALRSLQNQGTILTAIWLTHHHPDHVGGVGRLRRSFDLPVLGHRDTGERLAGSASALDAFLEDSQEVRLRGGDGDTVLRVVHTPGHARGHLCFFEPRRRWLVAGDLVAGIGTIVVDPPEGDMDQYLASLERARDLGASTLFPGHGPAIADPRRHLDHYIQHRLWREERIRRAWSQGKTTVEQLLPLVYDDVEPIALPLARRQLLAHLERLRRRGELAD